MFDVVRVVPKARVQRIEEQLVEVLFPQITKGPCRRFPNRTTGAMFRKRRGRPVSLVDVLELTNAIEALPISGSCDFQRDSGEVLSRTSF